MTSAEGDELVVDESGEFEDSETGTSVYQRPTGLAIALIVFGLVGLWAAFTLLTETIEYFKDPSKGAACDFSVLVSCSHNIASSYGSLFGFPNPIIGLVAWPIVIATGVMLLGNVQLPAWYWRGFAFGTMLAIMLISGFISFSLYDLQALCPWCMLTWSVTIPTFWSVVLYAGKEGHLAGDSGLTRIAGKLYGWIPTLTVASYLVVIVLAQIQLDAVTRIFTEFFG